MGFVTVVLVGSDILGAMRAMMYHSDAGVSAYEYTAEYGKSNAGQSSLEAGKKWPDGVSRKAVSVIAVNGILYGNFNRGQTFSMRMARLAAGGNQTILGYGCEIAPRQALRPARVSTTYYGSTAFILRKNACR